MGSIDFIKRVSLFGLLATSTSFADPDFLKCYNEIHAPSKSVKVFGIPFNNSSKPDRTILMSRNIEPVSTAAYIVTSNTIVKKIFDYSQAKEIGTERIPSIGGQVRVIVSPIFEVDSSNNGTPTKIFYRAKWSLGLDHPNGASLSIVEESIRKFKKENRSHSSNVSTTRNIKPNHESQVLVIEYLKSEIKNASHLTKGSMKSFSSCHAIPELKDLIESKFNISKNPSQSKAMAPSASSPVPAR